jgi:protocatechuate 3,4-dioxygenase beta subunit
MSFSARSLPIIVLILVSVAVPLKAQSSTKAAIKSPRGTVSGRVTIKEKGAPGITVGLRKSDGTTPFEPYLKATTDQDGVYRITNVPAGSYDITPSALAFVLAQTPTPRGKTVIVAEDENVEGINFALVRGGVITGRITDADGRPLIQQQVDIFRAEGFDQRSQQQRQIFPSGNAQTDDRGIYRIFGLAAGRYKVASGRGDDAYSGVVQSGRALYKQVFHPDVSDQAKATIIEVSEGSEATNVDIALGSTVQTFSVSGRVVDTEKGLPMPNVRFGFYRGAGQRLEFINSYGTSNNQGDFIVEGFMPGKYSVFLFPDQRPELRTEAATFDIVDSDVTGVTVKLVRGSSLSGVVVLENEDKTPFAKLLESQLRAFVPVPAATGSYSQSASSTISPDGSFRLAGLHHGTANFSLSTATGPAAPKGFAISRIERDGIVQPRGVEIKEGEQVTGLRVVVSYGTATIRGVIIAENGSLPERSPMFVRLGRSGNPLPPLSSVPVDARGHFLMEGLPAGVYELAVSVPGAPGRQPRIVKQEVNVQDGAVSEVSVTIDMAPTPKP